VPGKEGSIRSKMIRRGTGSRSRSERAWGWRAQKREDQQPGARKARRSEDDNRQRRTEDEGRRREKRKKTQMVEPTSKNGSSARAAIEKAPASAQRCKKGGTPFEARRNLTSNNTALPRHVREWARQRRQDRGGGKKKAREKHES